MSKNSHENSTILVVEDNDQTVAQLTKALLLEKYRLLFAADGVTAVEMVRKHRPDLVLLDLNLPVLDGASVCRIIKNDQNIWAIPIIVVSATGMESQKIELLDQGADDYIVKPFTLSDLLIRTRNILRSRERHQSYLIPKEIVSGSLRLDTVGKKVYKNDVPLYLSAREFALLEALMTKPGQVLTRDFLLVNVWGYDSVVVTTTVDAHINFLRNKIEDDPKNPKHITTVRGIGYRFEK